MNSFYEHHKDSINWHYHCFDRILLNGLIQPFQQPERVVGFFNTYRQLYPVTRDTLRGIADQFQRWVTERAEKRNIPIVEAPKGRRDEFIDPYFERAKPDAVVAILKAREPARIMIAIGDKVANRWHLQFAQRWVIRREPEAPGCRSSSPWLASHASGRSRRRPGDVSWRPCAADPVFCPVHPARALPVWRRRERQQKVR